MSRTNVVPPPPRPDRAPRKQAMSVGALIAILQQMPQGATLEMEMRLPARGLSTVKGGKLRARLRHVQVDTSEIGLGSIVRLMPTEEPVVWTTKGISQQKGRD